MGKLVFFDIGHPLLVDFNLCAPNRLVFFDIGHLLLVDFDLCAPTRLIFLTLVSHSCWTLARLCAPTHPTRLVGDMGKL